MIQAGVAALVKDSPFTADCALSWIIGGLCIHQTYLGGPLVSDLH